MITGLSAENGFKTAPSHLRGLGQAILRCGSIADLRAFAPLPDEAQRVIDTAVTDVGLERLVIVRDLLAAGLIYELEDPLSVLEVYWEAQSKVGGAQRSMHPGARGENQLRDLMGFRIPVYATTEDFQFGIRTLRASQRVGSPLDTAMASQAVRRVHESIEDAAINGATTEAGTLFTVNGNSAPGLLNHPSRNTYAYAGSEAWDAASNGHTGEEILVDVLAMIDKLQDDHFYGPYNLYVPTSYGMKLMEDFKANSSDTIMTRLQAIQAGGRNLSIGVADQLPANRTVLMQMTSDVADVIVGQEPIPLTWESANGLERYFLILAFMVPRIKRDYDGNSGIVVGFTS